MKKRVERVGLDARVVLAFEIAEHPRHGVVRSGLLRLVRDPGVRLAIGETVLETFLREATDGERLEVPLTMQEAVRRAAFWWNAEEVVRLPATEESYGLFLEWVGTYRPGARRLPDCRLSALLEAHGVRELLTTDPTIYREWPGPKARHLE